MVDLFILDEILPGSDAPIIKALRQARGKPVDLRPPLAVMQTWLRQASTR
jgi:hypothetical protein